MRYFTSDTHFGHKNIIKYCERPFKDFTHMDEVLINNWNSVVGDTDVVYHLGDVALGVYDRWAGIFERLNGYKVLIVGNHDRIFAGNAQKIFDRHYDDYANWFDEFYANYVGLSLGDTIVNLSHFPYDGDSHDGDRYTEYRLSDEGVTLIHGHTHSTGRVSRSKRNTLQIHVGADAWDYTPVPEETIIQLIKEEK